MAKQIDKKSLIILDLDGTTLNDRAIISDENKKVITEIAKKHHVCIVTGRPFRASLNYYYELGLTTILSNFNGAYMSNPSDPLFTPVNLVINKEIIKTLFRDTKIKNLMLNAIIECRTKTYLQNTTDAYQDNYFHLNEGVNRYVGEDFYHKVEEDVSSVVITTNSEEKKWKIFAILKEYSKTLSIREIAIPDSKWRTIEINSKFATKETAAKYLGVYYNVSRENIYAFGDSYNDAEVLHWVINSFAMKNGSSHVKTIARYVTDKSNNESGVGHELKKIFKIRSNVKPEDKKVKTIIKKKKKTISKK